MSLLGFHWLEESEAGTQYLEGLGAEMGIIRGANNGKITSAATHNYLRRREAKPIISPP